MGIGVLGHSGPVRGRMDQIACGATAVALTAGAIGGITWLAAARRAEGFRHKADRRCAGVLGSGPARRGAAGARGGTGRGGAPQGHKAAQQRIHQPPQRGSQKESRRSPFTPRRKDERPRQTPLLRRLQSQDRLRALGLQSRLRPARRRPPAHRSRSY